MSTQKTEWLAFPVGWDGDKPILGFVSFNVPMTRELLRRLGIMVGVIADTLERFEEEERVAAEVPVTITPSAGNYLSVNVDES